jgi:hypothetical protein
MISILYRTYLRSVRGEAIGNGHWSLQVVSPKTPKKLRGGCGPSCFAHNWLALFLKHPHGESLKEMNVTRWTSVFPVMKARRSVAPKNSTSKDGQGCKRRKNWICPRLFLKSIWYNYHPSARFLLHFSCLCITSPMSRSNQSFCTRFSSGTKAFTG